MLMLLLTIEATCIESPGFNLYPVIISTALLYVSAVISSILTNGNIELFIKSNVPPANSPNCLMITTYQYSFLNTLILISQVLSDQVQELCIHIATCNPR